MGKNLTPEVSVIMPVYNCVEFVSDAIKSILNQTYSNFELIIIDDSSTDRTKEVIKSFSDNRITLIEKPFNTGYTESLNTGLELAKGIFIARMDGDDISMPDRLEIQLAFLKKNPEVILCGTSYKIIGTDEIIHHPENHDDLTISFLSGCHIAHPTVMMRRSILQKYNLQYDPSCEPAEDYDLWVRLLSYGKIANIQEVLFKYRIHESQISVKSGPLQIEQANKARIKLLKIIIPEGLLTSNNTSLHFSLMKNELAATFAPDQVENWLNLLILNNSRVKFFHIQKFNMALGLMTEAYIKKYFINKENHRPNLVSQWYKYRTKIKLTVTESIIILANSTLGWLLRETKRPQKLVRKINVLLLTQHEIFLDNIKPAIVNNFNIYLNPKTRKQKLDTKSIPIIINNFNQLVYVKKLIEDLKIRGYNNIFIIDNNSTYQPLLDFYKTTDVKVYRLNNNDGHKALWKNRTLFKQFASGYYVLTDPDILVNEECPTKFLNLFIDILENNKKITKVGFALQINDIPDYYPLKETVLNWEGKFWQTKIASDQFIAPIDTTFALYRPYSNLETEFCSAIRVAGKCLAKHMGWYYNPNNLSTEEAYYMNTACDSTTTWFVDIDRRPRKNVEKTSINYKG